MMLLGAAHQHLEMPWVAAAPQHLMAGAIRYCSNMHLHCTRLKSKAPWTLPVLWHLPTSFPIRGKKWLHSPAEAPGGHTARLLQLQDRPHISTIQPKTSVLRLRIPGHPLFSWPHKLLWDRIFAVIFNKKMWKIEYSMHSLIHCGEETTHHRFHHYHQVNVLRPPNTVVWMAWLSGLPGGTLCLSNTCNPSPIPARSSSPQTTGNCVAKPAACQRGAGQSLFTHACPSCRGFRAAPLSTGCRGSSWTRIGLCSEFMLNLNFYLRTFRWHVHCYPWKTSQRSTLTSY